MIATTTVPGRSARQAREGLSGLGDQAADGVEQSSRARAVGGQRLDEGDVEIGVDDLIRVVELCQRDAAATRDPCAARR